MTEQINDKLLHDIHSEACYMLSKGIMQHLIDQGLNVPDPKVEHGENDDRPEDDEFSKYSISKKSRIMSKNFGEQYLKDCPIILNGEIELNKDLLGLYPKDDKSNEIQAFKIKFNTKVEYEINGIKYTIDDET